MDMAETLREITPLESRIAYKNPWLCVREDIVRRPDGSQGLYGVVERPDFVVLIPLQHGRVTLVEQYRYPVGRRVWELPMGCCEPGVAPDVTAAVELREETGLVAGTMTLIAPLLIAPGFCDQVGHVYLATDLRAGPTARELSEQGMIAREFPVAELDQMVVSGVMQDAVSLAALAMVRFRGLL